MYPTARAWPSLPKLNCKPLLYTTLGNSKSEWIIVIGHHPVVSSGGHGSESSTATMYDNIRSELVKYKAALYICGHDHMLEHIVDKT